MLNWYAIPSTEYYAAEEDTLSAENLYFLTDTHELYRGTVPFTMQLFCILVKSLILLPVRRFILIPPLCRVMYMMETSWTYHH